MQAVFTMNKRLHRRLCAECFDMLSSHGVKVDEGVIRLIGRFFSLERHMAFADFEELARTENLNLTPGSIRKAIKLLVEYGFAVEKTFTDGRVVYEHLHMGEHHDHCYCLHCGKIVEFFSPALEDLQNETARLHQFHPFSHRLQINGLCDACFGEARRNLVPLSGVLPGGRFRIIEVQSSGGRGFGQGGMRRLAEIGLVADASGEVVSNHGLMFVVQIGGNRLALRKGQAAKILVTLE